LEVVCLEKYLGASGRLANSRSSKC